MGTAEMANPVANGSVRSRARVAGALYVAAVLIAVAGESFLHARLAIVAGLAAVACYVAVTLLLYFIFRPVNQLIALLAVAAHIVGFTFEAFRWNPLGIDFGVVCHGVYCLLAGYLVLKSTFLPRILGVLIALAGIAWLTFLSPVLGQHISPYNVAAGFLGEAPLMFWLLAMSVNATAWTVQSGLWRTDR